MDVRAVIPLVFVLASYGCGGGGGSDGGTSSNSSPHFATASSPAEAATRQISCPSSAVESGAKLTPTSQNFFEEINLPADGEIVVYTDRSEFDTYCYLLNQLGNIITSSDDGGNGDNCSITASLRAGTYSILIRAYDSTSTGNFYLGSSCIGPYQKLTDPTADPDNSGGGGVDPGGLGDLSFVLIWTYTGSSRSEGPDIDIWVENPDGERLSTSRDGLALGPDSYGGTIDLDDRGGWGAGIGSGPERLSWPVASAPAGSYSFGTRYFEGDGDVEVTLKVYRGSTVTSTWIDTMTAAGQTKNLGTIAYP